MQYQIKLFFQINYIFVIFHLLYVKASYTQVPLTFSYPAIPIYIYCILYN